MNELEKLIEKIETLLRKAKIIPQAKLMAMEGTDFQELWNMVQKTKVSFDEMRKDFPLNKLKLSKIDAKTLIKLRVFYDKWLRRSD